jgi:nitrate reductase assembly molybdenum cofactor insertion protein NarJ
MPVALLDLDLNRNRYAVHNENKQDMIKTKNSRLTLLSALTDFPLEGFTEKVKEIQLYLDGCYPELGQVLEPFTEFVSTASLDEMQELHTRTFEVQAITTLDVGYLLFGDDYKRAELLVNLSREHTAAANDCGYELADHLPNVIRLMDKMTDAELRHELAAKVVFPGLKKMVSEFDPHHLGKKNEVYVRHHKTLIDMPGDYGTLYQRPLMVLLEIFRSEFNLEKVTEDKTSDFLNSISTEMKLEP